MPEVEHLTLQIGVAAGDAAKEIARLRSELAQLGTGQVAQSHEKIKRAQKEQTENFSVMGAAANVAGLAFRFTAGVVTGGLLAIGEVLKQGVMLLPEWAGKMHQLAIAAKAIGADPAQFEHMIHEMEQFGMSASAASESLARLADYRKELFVADSEVNKQLVRDAEFYAEAFEGYKDKMMNAKDMNEQVNLARITAERVYQIALARTKDESTARAEQRRILRQQGLDESAIALGNLHKLSEEEAEAHNKRIAAASEFDKQITELSKHWDEAWGHLVGSHLGKDSALYQSVQWLSDKLAWINKTAAQKEAWEQAHPEEARKTQPGFGIGGGAAAGAALAESLTGGKSLAERFGWTGPRRQHGGSLWAGQSALVGEAGPEIFAAFGGGDTRTLQDQIDAMRR